MRGIEAGATPAGDVQELPRDALRLHVRIRGAVQGVGFRPFVYRLARELGVRGWVLNASRGVEIEAEGPAATLERFLLRLGTERPPLAIVQSLEHAFLDPVGLPEFHIRHSDDGGEKTVLVLPDVATCAACLREVRDPSDRRHRYPFTNCTHCGPRATIVEALPYDRPRTSMRHFPLCPACAREYEDPEDRRFHAQPVACPACGPQLWAEDGSGVLARGEGAIALAERAVRAGEVVAVKGLGGFHLLVDARDAGSVARLRERKRREEKPLALMYPSLEAVAEDCEVSPMEARLLTAPERPIVLLRRRPGARIAGNVAPGNPYLGCMLPYTPLHHILLEDLGFPVVATSGNLTDEPIAKDNKEGLARLTGVADVFLLHDRGIVRRMEDSVVRVVRGREVVLRRARGFAPLPIPVKDDLPALLALGGHLKNTVAFARGRQVFVSPHLGDLDTKLAHDAFVQANRDLQGLYDFTPEAVAVDRHPAYLSTRYGEGLGLPVHRVQHHMAHVASCAAENELEPPLLGAAWDGTGYGMDGTVWGGEFLRWADGRFDWVAGFADFPLLGGEKAVREPRRTALALLHAAYGDDALGLDFLPTIRALEGPQRDWFAAMLRSPWPRARSVGRLFDGVSSMLGLVQRATFEGQAAMAVEHAARAGRARPYPYALTRGSDPRVLVRWEPIVRGIVEGLRAGEPVGDVAARFQATLAEVIVEIAHEVGESKVVLSGGVFQNALLSARACDRLAEEGFRPYVHQRVPPNDGGISLGQIVVAAEAMRLG